MSHFLSVVIPTFNGGDVYKKLVKSLQSQTYFSKMEIIVIDSGSTDDTLIQTRKITDQIYKIEQSEFNHGGTRNYGAEISRGEYICFLTQDAIPLHSNFFEKLIDGIKENQAAGGYARQVPRKEATPLICRDVNQWVSGLHEKRIVTLESMSSFLKLNPLERYLLCIFDNVASMIRRDVWEQIPLPSTPFGEDIEWAYRVLCNGHTIVYEPDAVVEHSHERSPSYLYKRSYVDHYRLYELFGVRTIPARRNAWLSFLNTSLKDWHYLSKQIQPNAAWCKQMRDVPRNAWASAWGQYDGAKTAANGVPVYQSKEV